MKLHEHLFLSRHTAMKGEGAALKKFSNIWQLICQLCLTTLTKTWKIVACFHFCVGFSKLVYLEFWNSSDPFEEYIPDFTKTSRCVQDKCAHMITETVSLLKHIRSCQFLPNINKLERMDELQKLNRDLILILDEYFNMGLIYK